MKRIITYTEEQINQIISLLNAVTIVGIQNAKQMAIISQVLEAGIYAEIQEEKKEGD